MQVSTRQGHYLSSRSDVQRLLELRDSNEAVCFPCFTVPFFGEFMIWECLGMRKQVWGPCTDGNTTCESFGSVPEAIFLDQEAQKQISSAWRPKFERKSNFFKRNATKSRFKRAPSDISAIPTYLDGSWGPAWARAVQNNEHSQIWQLKAERRLDKQTVQMPLITFSQTCHSFLLPF